MTIEELKERAARINQERERQNKEALEDRDRRIVESMKPEKAVSSDFEIEWSIDLRCVVLYFLQLAPLYYDEKISCDQRTTSDFDAAWRTLVSNGNILDLSKYLKEVLDSTFVCDEDLVDA